MLLDNSQKPHGDQYPKKKYSKIIFCTYFKQNFVKMCSAVCVVTKLQTGWSRVWISMGADVKLFNIYQCHFVREQNQNYTLWNSHHCDST